MSVRMTARRRLSSAVPPYVEEPGWTAVSGMITAGAVMACADGRPDRTERLSLLAFLRRRGILLRFNRRRVLVAFDTKVAWLHARSVAELCSATDSLRLLTSSSTAPLVAAAASHVAIADGEASPQEIVVLRVIRTQLGLTGPNETSTTE